MTEVRDGRAVGFRGDPGHPITRGWLCAKVRPYLDFVYHPDRLLTPLRRVGPKGSPSRWEPLSWDDAIGEIAARWQQIIDRYGAAAILPYSFSGTTGWINLGLSNRRLWNRMGASGLQRSICNAAASAAVHATYGARWAPEYTDVVHSRLVILWGHNPTSTAPHFMPMLREAQQRGAYVVVIDPRRTLTARSANEHIRPRPATDAALALGLMQVIFAESLHDEAWLEANTVGWRDLRDRAANYPPERVAEITGVPAQTIIDLARRLGSTKPALVKFADGVQRHGNGGQTTRAIIGLPAVVGQVGVRGGGLSYSTGDYIDMDAEVIGHASECPPTPRVVNMNRLGAALTGEVTDPPIMSLFVFASSPAAIAPNSGLVVQGLMREDLFTVVHDLFITDTARYADIVLPSTSQLEHTDMHEAYGHRFLHYNEPAIAPLGESKSNWDVMRLLAEALGYTEPWLRQTAEEAIAELLDASRPISPVLRGITFERLRAEGTVPLYFPPGAQVPFSDGRFPTPSGKLELRSDTFARAGLDPLPDFTPPPEFAGRPAGDTRLVLITGAANHFLAGVVVSPKGRWQSSSLDGHNVNWTTSDALGDIGGQSTFHSNLVDIRPA